MKNPQDIYVPNSDSLVAFAGFIAYVDTKNEKFNRVCFKADTRDRNSELISVTAFKGEGNRPDFKALTEHAKGRYAVVIAAKRETPSKDGSAVYQNYILENLFLFPEQNK